jgi:hypothetical protein
VLILPSQSIEHKRGFRHSALVSMELLGLYIPRNAMKQNRPLRASNRKTIFRANGNLWMREEYSMDLMQKTRARRWFVSGALIISGALTTSGALTISGALIIAVVAPIVATPARAAAAGTQQAAPPAAQSPNGPGSTVRQVGTVKTVGATTPTGTPVTLSTDAGTEVTIQIQDTTRIVRIAPGQKDLKSATPAQLQDIEAGDRLLVGGKLGDDGKTVVASTAVVMKHADVEQTQEQQREDWQKNGIGGIVSSVDATQGSVVITQTVAGVKKTVTIQATGSTIIRRYAPQSVKFEDAQRSTLDLIKPGDQVRARGTMGADGTSFSAEEIVTGEFRNISGTISSINAAAGTLTVMDLGTKKPILVSISSDSQVRRLAPFMAQRIAARLKGAAPAGGGAETGGNSGAGQAGGPPANGGGSGGGAGYRSGGGAGGAAGGGADLQQMLARLPAATLADFQKGDAVMIVSTEGTASAGVTAITLLGGVEPILEATPNQASAVLLSPWTIGGPSGADAGE